MTDNIRLADLPILLLRGVASGSMRFATRKLFPLPLIAGFALSALAEETPSAANPVRHDAATALLLQNLLAIGKCDRFLFGQANALTLSYDGNPVAHPYNGTSDVKDVTGAHPAFVESDFMWYKDPRVKAYDMEAMREAYRQGMLCGYCWHMAGMYAETFNTSGDGAANNRLVKDILAQPDREKNKALDWFLTEYETKAIPVFQELGFPLVFRPLHEMTGTWFWWGSKIPPKESSTSGGLPPESPEASILCTPQEFVQLYRLLVTHLRSKNVRNLLFVWAPDKSADMRYYPGDEYVDVIGYDGYDQGLMNYYTLARHTENLQALSDFAREHNKPFALTETGCLMEYRVAEFDFPTGEASGGNPGYSAPDGESLDNDQLVNRILDDDHPARKKALDWLLAGYDTKIIPRLGKIGAPALFRPFHGVNGDWFRWDFKSGSPEEYARLFGMVVTHLRSRCDRSILYAWSPSQGMDLSYYPGDEYVDVIVYNAFDPGTADTYPLSQYDADVRALAEFADRHGKASTVIDADSRVKYPATNSDFWTKNVLGPLKENGRKSVEVAYVMTWYNADWKHDGRSNAFVPYLGIEKRPGGQAALSDFLMFRRDPAVMLADDISPMRIYSEISPEAGK